MAASKPVAIAPCREFPEEIKEQARTFHSALLNLKETLSPILSTNQEVVTEEPSGFGLHPWPRRLEPAYHIAEVGDVLLFFQVLKQAIWGAYLTPDRNTPSLLVSHRFLTREWDSEPLSPLDKARLDLTLLYTLNSLFWMYLCTVGEDPKQHSVRRELDRVKEYMTRAKQIADKAKAPKLVAGAAQRFVRNALWTPTDDSQKDGQEPPRKKRR
ncbi:hypothetical protein HPB50_001177 [Hyalomma asiaticum]|uniref:Uncharacterized protein n=1 Tax=Hyalomma asiaticum TaxID=266040 RepID=A0ACB7RTY4_HYAAI|nr:hypothetical protein HPB50_001177 [Hyalomma asiaticum]